MKFSLLSVLVAAVFLFGFAAAAAVVEVTTRDETSGGPAASAAIVEVTTRDETSDGPGRPPRRTLVSKKNLPAAAVAAAKPSKFMFLQTGTDCALTPSATSGEYLFRATVGTATTYFSERPDRLAGTMMTQVFVGNFEDPFFVTSNPNVAITFSGNNSNTGPLIVVLSRPHMVSSSIIEYTMTQSSSQGEVASIDQFMETSGSCSIFIDLVLIIGNDTNRAPCLPAVGKFGGNSTSTHGARNPYETCYKYGSVEKYCWSKSYFSGDYYQCKPKGDEWFSGWYAVDNDDMKYVNPVTHPYSCGDPCQKFQ